MQDLPVTPFWRRFRGPFYGLLKWHDMDKLWETLKASPEGWYIFDMPEVPPCHPANAADLTIFLDETAAFLRKKHRQDYCGLIYVDDRDEAEFIKIFDPGNMGTACGCSTKTILPRWTLTRLKPDAPLAAERLVPQKSGLIDRLFDRVRAN